MNGRKNRTVSEVFLLCLKHHWNKERFKKSRYLKEVVQNYERHIKGPLGEKNVVTLSAPSVDSWHAKIKSPYAANRAKSVLSQIFRYAIRKGYVPLNHNPCAVVPNHDEVKRERFATVEEIQKISDLLSKYDDTLPHEAAFIRLLMFTGSRPSAIERATWHDLVIHEIGGQTMGLLKVQGKTGVDEIPVYPEVLRCLFKLNQPPTGTLTGIKFPRRFWDRIRKEAGCPDLWARDWRRTFGTLGLSSGVPIGMLAELMNHSDQKTTMRYAKLVPTARLQAALNIGRELERISR